MLKRSQTRFKKRATRIGTASESTPQNGAGNANLKMNETIKFEESSGNVFLDIGFFEKEGEHELLRSDLAFEIYRILKERILA